MPAIPASLLFPPSTRIVLPSQDLESLSEILESHGFQDPIHSRLPPYSSWKAPSFRQCQSSILSKIFPSMLVFVDISKCTLGDDGTLNLWSGEARRASSTRNPIVPDKLASLSTLSHAGSLVDYIAPKIFSIFQSSLILL